jgi:creatinine amidohydrolase
LRKLYWSELATTDFAGLDPEKAIAVLPVAAIEQHGPHLPIGTDTLIAEGMIGEVVKRLPNDLSILILPTQAIGKSNEHLRSPGTLTLTAETALGAWVEIGESVHRAGVRKLVLVNSHFGLPAGLYTDEEAAVGIHAGDIETSLMLHFRPDLVRMDKAQNFAPATIEIAKEFAHLRPTGFTAFGWIAQDLHPSGAAGDASRATAEKGRATAEFQALQFIKLLQDVVRFSLARLA